MTTVRLEDLEAETKELRAQLAEARAEVNKWKEMISTNQMHVTIGALQAENETLKKDLDLSSRALKIQTDGLGATGKERDEARAQVAAMREALEHTKECDFGSCSCDESVNYSCPGCTADFLTTKALSPSAGSALLERMRKLEAFVEGLAGQHIPDEYSENGVDPDGADPDGAYEHVIIGARKLRETGDEKSPHGSLRK